MNREELHGNGSSDHRPDSEGEPSRGRDLEALINGFAGRKLRAIFLRMDRVEALRLNAKYEELLEKASQAQEAVRAFERQELGFNRDDDQEKAGSPTLE